MPTQLTYGTNVENLTAEELANMSAAGLDSLLQQYDLDPSKYSKYFAKFNKEEIEAIQKNMELKKDQLGSRARSVIEGVKAQAVQGREAYKGAVAKRGFEVGGDIEQSFQRQQEALFGKAGGEMAQISAGRSGAELAAKEAKRSVYEDYQEQFMGALTEVEGLIGEEEAAIAEAEEAEWWQPWKADWWE